MKAQNKKLYGVLAMVLAIVMLAALVPALRTDASAYASLSHIQEIKAQKTMFRILEIAPAEGTGSLGYYSADYEPTSNWRSDAAKKHSPAARKTYADEIFTALKARGLMNASVDDTDEEKEKYPLTFTGDYVERYPWEEIPEGVETTLLKLLDENNEPYIETALPGTIYGTFVQETGGAFIRNSSAVYAEPEGSGEYNQNVQYYVYCGDEDPRPEGESSETYFYNPQFTVAQTSTEEELLALKGKALYTKVTEGDKVYYKWEGNLGVKDFRITTGEEYYVPVQTQDLQPSKAPNAETAPYYAELDKADKYVPANGTGYFNITVTDYEYVGEGGAYTLEPGDTTVDKPINYDSVYVYNTSGYKNNNWFQRYVFDIDKTDLADLEKQNIIVRVETIVPGARNATGNGINSLMTLINNYDMVVITAGFDYNTGNMPATKYTADTDGNTIDNDLTPEQADLIYSLLTDSKKPVIIDSRLASADYTQQGKTKPNIQKLAEAILNGKTAPIVTGSLYCFTPDDISTTDTGNDKRSALATKNFNLEFDPTLSAGDDKPYSEVRIGIDYENFLRENAGLAKDEWLPMNITMATCIRYIINYSGQLAQNKKDAISVLDVEPRTQSVTNVATKDGTTGLNKQTVRQWLGGDSCPISDKNISITTMSTAEFISRIDDINEEYDLVYIGASLKGFNLDAETKTPVYNDGGNMNGLIYCNIGDKYNANSSLDGLKPDGTACRFSGNDITNTKATQLKNFAASGFPVIVADELVNAAQTATAERKLSVSTKASVSKEWKGWLIGYYVYNISLTATPVVDAGELPSDLSYIWFYQGTDESIGTSQQWPNSPTANTSYRTPDGYFYCEVTYSIGQDKYTAVSNKVYVDSNFVINSQFSGDSCTFTATNLNGNTPVKWYVKNNSEALGTSTYTVSDGRQYYCKWTSNGWFDDDEQSEYVSLNGVKGSSVKIPAQEARDETINPGTVDVNSILYSTLSGELTRNNVMSANKAKNNSAMLLKYLNLPKPSLNVTEKPTPYAGDFSQSLVTNGMLQYTFTISNTTDPTPVSTRYTCGLYIDLNADGKFSDDEQISDLVITDENRKMIGDEALSAGVKYTVRRSLPENYSGIIPWRLMVTQNGTDGRIHASQVDYTFIKPQEATKINILQITSKDGLTSNTFKLGENDGKASVNEFEKCFTDLKNAGIYDINIEYKTVAEVNTMSPVDIKMLFDTKNMLVLGFGDTYGKAENGGLDSESATAITQFIATGKAVLFSHDTTSFYNKNVSGGWGFNFNQLIRDSVGLDRYGAMRNSSVETSYTDTYQPGQKGAKVNSTQGYTDLILLRYSGSNSYTCGTDFNGNRISTTSGNRATTTVSQVNAGQITTYPYQIAETIPVAETHEQYYQLNMNSDDVVVWYCLSGNNYNYFKHDGTNAYYIYNRGNVTYTGAGHTVGTNESISGDEARLFVNTMVAAYRAAAVAPSIAFKTADSQNITTKILPVDIDGDIVSGAADTRAYFTISDTNLVSSKSVKVDFYYMNGLNVLTDKEYKELTENGNPPSGYVAMNSPTIYLASDNKSVSGNLHSDTLYYVVVPKAVADTNKSSSAVTLLGVATTTIGKNENVAQYRGSATLILQKTGYLTLR